ncbi:MAG: T9SS type A sorting domain-containing protein [Flavobacteriales bacterium]|nr:T9SS type A sorting domain-containing protein [Flavobacteriales bacterium]
MKKTLILLLCLPSLVWSQFQLTDAPGRIVDLQNHHGTTSGEREVIWVEDFSNGIPAGWINTDAGGIATWEYRGPATNPNSEVGTRGSCLPAGVLGDPIISPSAPGGFVIFDSNWWDNPSNPCTPENFGTGPAPGPHVATLTTPSIDLSANTGVALVFHQYQKMYSGQTRVEVSVAGGEWWSVYVNPDTPNPTSSDDEVFVQLSLYAGGQSDVRIRFVFDGLYYFWMLDDIQIIDAFANDLAMNSINYGDFDLSDLSHPTGFEFMEYSKYPDEMSPLLKFSSMVENRGVVSQSDSRLNVKVLDFNDNVIHSGQSDEGFLIPMASQFELRAGSFQMPAVLDNYRIAFETSQQFADDQPSNNQDTAYFNINDVQYARDHYFTNAVYIATPDLESQPYEIGNVFLVTADNLSVHSLSVGVGIGSSTPATIYGKLYSFDISESLNATLIATTNPIEITQEMINDGGEQIMTNLIFSTPVAVESGTAYFVSVGCDDGTSLFVCALSGDTYEYTSYVRFNGTDWYTIDRIPMVRMNFGFYNDVKEEVSDLKTLPVFPNPADNELFIDLAAFPHDRITLKMTDQTGRIIMSENLSNNQSRYATLDLSDVATGVYQITAEVGLNRYHQTVIRK